MYDWKFQVFSRPHTPHVCYWLGHHCNHWGKKREKRGAKNGRGDGEIAGTDEKFGDSIISPTKDGTLIAQLPCSPFPHSLCFLVISLSFLGKALGGKDLYGLLGLSAILGLLKKLPV